MGTRRRVSVSFMMLVCVLGMVVRVSGQTSGESDRELVGHGDASRAVTPVNQVLTPAGQQLDLPGMRPQALALAPQGRLLVASGKTNDLVVIDPQTTAVRARVDLAQQSCTTSLPVRPSRQTF